jgi:hypothetical protein
MNPKAASPAAAHPVRIPARGGAVLAGRAGLRDHRRMGITPQRLQESLAERAAALARAGVPFAVAGAFAVAMHGHVRATRDIDFLVRLSDREAARRALEDLGYGCTLQGDGFAHFERRPLPDLPGVVERTDLLFSKQALGQRAIEVAMRQPMPWAHGSLPVVPLETLLLMKLMALIAAPSRPNDRSDLLELWRLHGRSVDVDRLRADAAAIGDDVVSMLESLLLGPAVRETPGVDEGWHRGL